MGREGGSEQRGEGVSEGGRDGGGRDGGRDRGGREGWEEGGRKEREERVWKQKRVGRTRGSTTSYKIPRYESTPISTYTGDAYFYDLSIRRDLDAIRSVLGVCPQHDVLWGDLTALEHMKLFGNLKDIPRQQMEKEIDDLLTDVQLERVRS